MGNFGKMAGDIGIGIVSGIDNKTTALGLRAGDLLNSYGMSANASYFTSEAVRLGATYGTYGVAGLGAVGAVSGAIRKDESFGGGAISGAGLGAVGGAGAGVVAALIASGGKIR